MFRFVAGEDFEWGFFSLPSPNVSGKYVEPLINVKNSIYHLSVNMQNKYLKCKRQLNCEKLYESLWEPVEKSPQIHLAGTLNYRFIRAASRTLLPGVCSSRNSHTELQQEAIMKWHIYYLDGVNGFAVHRINICRWGKWKKSLIDISCRCFIIEGTRCYRRKKSWP